MTLIEPEDRSVFQNPVADEVQILERIWTLPAKERVNGGKDVQSEVSCRENSQKPG